MSRGRILSLLALLSLLLLILTIPWGFNELLLLQIWGFPPWAFYCFCAAVAYALIMALLLGRFWNVLEGDEAHDG